MHTTEYLQLMKFPKQWLEWGMYPEELASIQMSGYREGHEDSSEHDRNGAFHWWLRNEKIDKLQLQKLVRLSYLDPDLGLGSDVRKYIVKLNCCDEEIVELIKRLAK